MTRSPRPPPVLMMRAPSASYISTSDSAALPVCVCVEEYYYKKSIRGRQEAAQRRCTAGRHSRHAMCVARGYRASCAAWRWWRGACSAAPLSASVLPGRWHAGGHHVHSALGRGCSRGKRPPHPTRHASLFESPSRAPMFCAPVPWRVPGAAVSGHRSPVTMLKRAPARLVREKNVKRCSSLNRGGRPPPPAPTRKEIAAARACAAQAVAARTYPVGRVCALVCKRERGVTGDGSVFSAVGEGRWREHVCQCRA